MKKSTLIIAAIATSLLSAPVFAQNNNTDKANNASDSVSITKEENTKGKRGPIDFEKFSRLEGLKAADTNGDGELSREELEAHAQKRIVKRMADRMERRLDINGDGKITLAEIENQRQKEFAALDRNEDGKLDRKELRAAGKSHGKNVHHAKGHHHSKGKMERHHQKMEKKSN